MLENFVKVADMPQEVIERYGQNVPKELLRIWQEDGLGTFASGYLKVINPLEYMKLIQDTYFRGRLSIPVFMTAFGDIIVLEENKYLRIVKYRDGAFVTILENMHYFIVDLSDDSFWDDYFEVPFYQEAVKKLGYLEYKECFGFVPLLALGGKKDVEHLDKVGALEHLLMVTQLTGGVGFD